MNKKIEQILSTLKIDNKKIPVSFLKYDGNENSYIVYQNIKIDSSYYADDELQNYMDYYDIDIYSKSNYFKIVKEIKKIMKNNGFIWQPTMTSEDFYYDDTGFYHKTLCFSIERKEENG